MKSVLFLVSGGGGNLKFIHQAMNSGIIKDVCLGVIADRECGALEYAKKIGFLTKRLPIVEIVLRNFCKLLKVSLQM